MIAFGLCSFTLKVFQLCYMFEENIIIKVLKFSISAPMVLGKIRSPSGLKTPAINCIFLGWMDLRKDFRTLKDMARIPSSDDLF